jgi:hypothetical protein
MLLTSVPGRNRRVGWTATALPPGYAVAFNAW